jgi:two-component system sensor histidine kinase EvgS
MNFVTLVNKQFFAGWNFSQSSVFALTLFLAVQIGLAGMAWAQPATPARVNSAPVLLDMPQKLTAGMLAGGWAPLDLLVNGKPAGLSIDYLRLVLPADVSLEVKTFPDMPALLKAACEGQVDIVLSVARTPQRERCLMFSAPYFRSTVAVVTRKGESELFDAARLGLARIAVEKGFLLEIPLAERYPHAEIVVRQTTSAALRAVADGDADAYFGFAPAVRYALRAGHFHNLHIAFEETSRMDELHFAMPRSRAALRNQIDAALARLRPVDESAIRARWIGSTIDSRAAGPSKGVELNEQEMAYLRALPVITMGFDTSWAPFTLRRSVRSFAWDDF